VEGQDGEFVCEETFVSGGGKRGWSTMFLCLSLRLRINGMVFYWENKVIYNQKFL